MKCLRQIEEDAIDMRIAKRRWKEIKEGKVIISRSLKNIFYPLNF